MQALHEAHFPVPAPVAQNRHVVLMELIPNAAPLYQVKSLHDPKAIYEETVAILRRILEQGLVHGDFNEFNLLISTTENEDGAESEVSKLNEIERDCLPVLKTKNIRRAEISI